MMLKNISWKMPFAARRSVQSFLFLVFLLLLLSVSGCISHLREAKIHYAQGQKISRLYDTEQAIAFFKLSLNEAVKEVKKHPSAQAYMLKGMAELSLKMWKEAEESFRNAFSYGFEEGEEWAQQLSLFGLASALEELGVEEPTFRIYSYLTQKSKLKPVTIMASQKYVESLLEQALREKGEEREKLLKEALKTAEKLVEKDLSCGFYHYLQSQVYSHLADYKKSFEEALMARELGLPTQEIFRDNDLQIVFCYRKLKEMLSAEKWEEFHALYMEWVKRWKWGGPETPVWKEKEKNAALH